MDKREPKAQSGAARPLTVFAFLLVAIVLVTGAAYLLTRSDPATSPAATPQATPSATNHRLTDAEALAQFDQLNEWRQRALEDRDTRILARAFTESSPAARRLRRSIATLRRNGGFANEKRRLLSLEVVARQGSQIKLREVFFLDVVFKDATGKDITSKGGLEKQAVIWTLRFEDGSWRIHDGSIVASHPVRR